MAELPAGSLRLPHLTMQHFELALLKSKPSVSQADLEHYIEWTKTFGQEG
jgi:SpoVK/Ycf46/Vps4 family AAA+-type ATPase